MTKYVHIPDVRILKRFWSLIFLCLYSTVLPGSDCYDDITFKSKDHPNVILILTDDQGIGDLSCHGNPWIKTPHLDSFYDQAVRFTDFHVSPVCTPTRAALMTGRYPINTGTWATYKGRDALAGGTMTIADIFRQNGYRTGLFGKWHLGDNYPSRATDCGFDLAVHHKAGGVGELSDYWGNSYFDDVYFVNNVAVEFTGYCTDIWFDEAIKFIDAKSDQPFFAYISTNAPHSPFKVAEQYSAPYRHLENKEIRSADFYGMITNIDENVGELEQYLKRKDLYENTIVIFMTDNGSGGGISRDGRLGFNRGFRGMKGDKTEGGHRVPFFIRWPGQKIGGGKDINVLAAHIDIFPTLASLCQISVPDQLEFDGIDLSSVILNDASTSSDRTLFIHHRQDWRAPEDVDGSCMLTEHYRLINGRELYQIRKDPFQEIDVASHFPEIVEKLLKENELFVSQAKTRPDYYEFPVSIVGNEIQQEINLTIQHAIGESPGIWKAEHVAAGLRNKNNTHAIMVEKEGLYEISCRRWPSECSGPIHGIPDKNPKDMYHYEVIKPDKVQIQIANQIHEKSIKPNDHEVKFHIQLEKGKTFLVNDFIIGDTRFGVYYTSIRSLE